MIGTRLVGGCQTAGGVGTAAGGGAIDFLLTYWSPLMMRMCGSESSARIRTDGGARAGVFSRMM